MFPFVSAQFLREISLLSNPSKTPALGKASVSKAEPSTAAFETRRRGCEKSIVPKKRRTKGLL